MTPIDLRVGPIGTAVACGAIVSNLIDALLANGILTRAQVRTLLESAMSDLTPRSSREGGRDAQRVISDLLSRLAEGTV